MAFVRTGRSSHRSHPRTWRPSVPLVGRCRIEAEEGVALTKVIARQSVPFVLRLFTGGGKHVDVASNIAASLKVWLERFRRNLTSIDVDGQEVNGVVLGVELIFREFAVVGVVVDAPQY